MTESWGWVPGHCSLLSELGSLHLEYQYLTHISHDTSYLEKVFRRKLILKFYCVFLKVLRVRKKLKSIRSSEGFYYTMYNPSSGNWCNSELIINKQLLMT